MYDQNEGSVTKVKAHYMTRVRDHSVSMISVQGVSRVGPES